MAKKQLADVVIHASDSRDDLGDYNLDISVDLIDDGLYLGNLACARDYITLQRLGITHILTLDTVPLPRTVLDHTEYIFKFIKLADIPKEDMITQLPETNAFLREAIANGGTVLVHCYFGVSRSAAVVIAYVMEKYSLCYEEAFTLVKAKRQFIGPNLGFVAQLKLFGHMGYTLNRDDPRFKQFRLKMAGQKLKQVKILPQTFSDLVKPDPGLARERPEPVVYRCKKCRRVLASQGNIIPHIPRELRVQLTKKGLRPQPSKLSNLTCAESGEILMEKLKSLASQLMDSREHADAEGSPGNSHSEDNRPNEEALDGYSEYNLVDGSITTRDAPAICRAMWFVEPLQWMDCTKHPEGKLHCPKCANKVGSFNWLMGCKCPCGQKVAPAFYLVPSKVERSNMVQNVQVTKKGLRPQPSKLSNLTCAESGEILMEKLKSLASQLMDSREHADAEGSPGNSHSEDNRPNEEALDGYSEYNLVDGSITTRDAPAICRAMWFVEPLQWMDCTKHPEGKLHCPKCANKVGSFNWLMGCKCPCGQKVAPAFYLVPSKVERSNMVQNVQVTV